MTISRFHCDCEVRDFFFFGCRVGVWMNREIRVSGGVRDDVVV